MLIPREHNGHWYRGLCILHQGSPVIFGPYADAMVFVANSLRQRYCRVCFMTRKRGRVYPPVKLYHLSNRLVARSESSVR